MDYDDERYPLGLSLRQHMTEYVRECGDVQSKLKMAASIAVDEKVSAAMKMVAAYNQCQLKDLESLLDFTDREAAFYDGAGLTGEEAKLLRIIAGVNETTGKGVVQLIISQNGHDVSSSVFSIDDAGQISEGIAEAARQAGEMQNE